MEETNEKQEELLQGKYIVLSNRGKKYEFNFKADNEVIYKRKSLDVKIETANDNFTYVLYKNKKYPIEIISNSQNSYEVLINNVSYSFTVETPISYKRKKTLKKNLPAQKSESVEAPMPGKIVDVLVENEAPINEGDPILILEAMKMQNEIFSHISGKITSINVKAGDTVNKDDVLVEIEK